MQELEEDADLRSQIRLYKGKPNDLYRALSAY